MKSVVKLSARALHTLSQRRWSGDEPEVGLTWGRLMSGDSLWDLYQTYHDFTSKDRILEIGPGYGRLLKAAQDRLVPFARYTGIDLSEARVERLRREFDVPGIDFVAGDIDNWDTDLRFDVVICSSTFEHLYPDCRRALRNIRRHLAPASALFIDFIYKIPRRILGMDVTPGVSFLRTKMKIPTRWFEKDGTYIRVYPKQELLAIFEECGYVVRAIDDCTLGEGEPGIIARLVVVARQG
jgi:SAM-dependent methyltransferase